MADPATSLASNGVVGNSLFSNERNSEFVYCTINIINIINVGLDFFFETK